MKFAICLYGQPRNYKLGIKHITEFMKKNNNHSFDFFLHGWIDKDKMSYSINYQPKDPKYLQINDEYEVINDLLLNYSPKKFKFEKSIKEFDISLIKNSKLYANSCQGSRNNIHNVLSQLYSRNQVRNVLEEYLSQNKNIEYDMVIMCRYDIKNSINLIIENFDKTITYAAGSVFNNKYTIPDNFIIIPTSIFLKWFKLFENLVFIMNNEDVCKKLNSVDNNLCLVSEALLLANYFYNYDQLNVKYIDMKSFIF